MRLYLGCFLALVVLALSFSAQAIAQKEKANDSSEQIRALQNKRVKLLETKLEHLEGLFASGKISAIDLLKTRGELIEAKLELAEVKAERVSLREQHRALAEHAVKIAQEQFASGQSDYLEVLAWQDIALRREIALIRENERE